MSHLQNVQEGLLKLRQSFRFEIADEDFERLTKWVKDEVLKSYRNGQASKPRGPAGVKKDSTPSVRSNDISR